MVGQEALVSTLQSPHNIPPQRSAIALKLNRVRLDDSLALRLNRNPRHRYISNLCWKRVLVRIHGLVVWSGLVPQNNYVLVTQHAAITQHHCLLFAPAVSQPPRDLGKRMHRVIVARAAKRGQAAENREWFFGARQRQSEVVGSELRYNGEARVNVQDVEFLFFRAGRVQAGVDGARDGRGRVEIGAFPEFVGVGSASSA